MTTERPSAYRGMPRERLLAERAGAVREQELARERVAAGHAIERDGWLRYAELMAEAIVEIDAELAWLATRR